MKITIITGQDGEIVGTARHGDGTAGVGNGGPIASPGQTTHEIELPSHLEKIEWTSTIALSSITYNLEKKRRSPRLRA